MPDALAAVHCFITNLWNKIKWKRTICYATKGGCLIWKFIVKCSICVKLTILNWQMSKRYAIFHWFGTDIWNFEFFSTKPFFFVRIGFHTNCRQFMVVFNSVSCIHTNQFLSKFLALQLSLFKTKIFKSILTDFAWFFEFNAFVLLRILINTNENNCLT